MQQNPTVGLWRVLGTDVKGADGKWRIDCECRCGVRRSVRYKDLRAGGSGGCMSCVQSDRMRNALQDTAHPYAQVRAWRQEQPKKNNFKHTDESRSIANTMSGARTRCTNPKDISYKNYGGRGIRFCFLSIKEAVAWVLGNLGPRAPGMTLDRIDNDRHYEPGNLRWATRSEQARNKRAYNGSVYGRRLMQLLDKRPDYTYEGLRKYIKLGFSDAEILSMQKPKGGRPRSKKC